MSIIEDSKGQKIYLKKIVYKNDETRKELLNPEIEAELH